VKGKAHFTLELGAVHEISPHNHPSTKGTPSAGEVFRFLGTPLVHQAARPFNKLAIGELG
jgi:hypothetical protein